MFVEGKKLADKIYITDTGSTDDTVKIAEEFGACITTYEWKNDFAAARNYALEQSDCDWNLILDADEYLVSGNKRDLVRFAEKGGSTGAIRRYDSYREDNGEISQSCMYTTRFVPKGTFYEGRVHEQIVSDLPIKPLPLVFEHDGYLQGGKGERNLEILLEELEEKPDDAYILYQVSRTLWLIKDYEQADGYFKAFYREVPEHEGVKGNGSFKAAYNLGVWFEVNGKRQEALKYYRIAKNQGYRPVGERMKNL